MIYRNKLLLIFALSIGILLFLSIVIFKEKRVEIVLINSVEKTPFLLSLNLNERVIFSDTLYYGGVPYPRVNIKTKEIRNNLVISIDDNQSRQVKSSIKFSCYFDKWIILGFYEEEGEKNIKVNMETTNSKYLDL